MCKKNKNRVKKFKLIPYSKRGRTIKTKFSQRCKKKTKISVSGNFRRKKQNKFLFKTRALFLLFLLGF